MKGFGQWLQQQKLSGNSINAHIKHIKLFLEWCTMEDQDPVMITYNDLIKYIQYHRDKGNTKGTTNIRMNSITRYLNYLIHIKQRKDNPAQYLRVKKEGRKMINNLLSPEQLENLYKDYLNRPEWVITKQSQLKQKRNIILLGLMIFQGMTLGELKKLEPGHINLEKSKIYIPATKRSNSRVLNLEGIQVLPLNEYLFQTNRSGKLFTCNVTNITDWLIKEIRQISGKNITAKLIRSSVIVGWLKQYNIRQVQYMAGHRYISSTERYRQEDISDLQKQLELFHPMK